MYQPVFVGIDSLGGKYGGSSHSEAEALLSVDSHGSLPAGLTLNLVQSGSNSAVDV